MSTVCLSVYLSIYLRLYSPLLEFDRFFSFLIFTQSVGLLGREISPSRGLCLHTGLHKRRLKANGHPCLKWDSNPRSHYLRGRRQLMPKIARPQRSAEYVDIYFNPGSFQMLLFQRHWRTGGQTDGLSELNSHWPGLLSLFQDWAYIKCPFSISKTLYGFRGIKSKTFLLSSENTRNLVM
jgi:hypothetical protein